MSTLTVILALTRLTFDRRLEARGDAVAGIAIDLAGIGLGVLGPYLLKLLVDRLSTGPIDPWSLAPLVAAFVLAWSGTAPLSAARYIFTTRQLGALSRHLIERATAQRLPQIARRRDADSGEMLGALERLPFSLQIVVDGLISRAASLIIQVVASLVVVATLVPPLYVALLATVLLGYFLASRLTAKRFQAQAQATNRSAASVSQLLGDILRNARRVVFNGNLDGEVERVAVLGRARQTEASRLALLLFGTALGQYVVVGAGLVAILVLGGMDVGRGRLTVGDFVLLQAYAFRLALPLGGLGFIIRQAGVAIENIAEVLDLAMARDPAVENRTTAISPAPRAAAIRLDGLFYAYGDTPVLTAPTWRQSPLMSGIGAFSTFRSSWGCSTGACAKTPCIRRPGRARRNWRRCSPGGVSTRAAARSTSTRPSANRASGCQADRSRSSSSRACSGCPSLRSFSTRRRRLLTPQARSAPSKRCVKVIAAGQRSSSSPTDPVSSTMRTRSCSCAAVD